MTTAEQVPAVTAATQHFDVTLTDGDHLEVVSDRARSNLGSGVSKFAWRIRAGRPIVMVRFFTPERDGVASLCDVEVRSGFRGAGLGLATIAEVGRLCGSVVHTSGSFTPKGFRSLAGQVPAHRGCVAAANFDDMVFVDDWDARTLLH